MRIVPALLCVLAAWPARADEGRPLSLVDAVSLAESRHPTILQNRAQVEAARARLEQARSLLLPAITGNFSYIPQTANFAPTPGFLRTFSRSPTGRDTVLDVFGNPISVSCNPPKNPDGTFDMSACQNQPPLGSSYSVYNYYSAALGINWILFDFGKMLYGMRAARELADAQSLTLQAARAQVAFDAKVAYFNVLAADASVRVAQDALSVEKKHLEQAQSFFQVGTRTKIDVSSAESLVAQAELTLARAGGTLESARALLAVALGEERWPGYRLETPSPDESGEPSEAQIFGEALSSRPEVREYRLRATGLHDVERAARGAFFPYLSLQMGPSWAGTDLAGMATNFSATLSLTFPLTGMNPLTVHGQLREARANYDLARALETQLRNQIQLDAADSHARLVSSREALAAARRLVKAARERRDLAEGRYQAGVGSFLELSDAELAFERAQFEEITAVLDAAQSRARLDRALGRL